MALSEAQASAVVNTVQERLKADNQITELLQPMKVLDALVSAHNPERFLQRSVYEIR